jgi:fructokinase
MGNPDSGLLGGVEAGGTTFRCAVANEPLSILDEATITTTTPDETLAAVEAFFRPHPIARVGIASFGPLGLDEGRSDFGRILETPKIAWQQTNLLEHLRKQLGAPCAIQTDVAAAALAEFHYGAARGRTSCVYATVGTGIGAAALVDGASPASRFHEEMGHMLVPRHPEDDFPGSCPMHGDCLEGLASATAIGARWQTPPQALPVDHPAWDIEAFYLAGLCVNVMRVMSPDVMLLGGGVLQQPRLLDKIRQQFVELANSYHTIPTGEVPSFIRHAALEPNAGLIGALHLATLAG